MSIHVYPCLHLQCQTGPTFNSLGHVGLVVSISAADEFSSATPRSKASAKRPPQRVSRAQLGSPEVSLSKTYNIVLESLTKHNNSVQSSWISRKITAHAQEDSSSSELWNLLWIQNRFFRSLVAPCFSCFLEMRFSPPPWLEPEKGALTILEIDLWQSFIRFPTSLCQGTQQSRQRLR